MISTANAIVLAYEEDPDGAGPLTIGSPYSGPVDLVLRGVGSGTVYSSFGPNGTTVGSSTPGTANAGVLMMDAVPQSPAPGRIAPSEDQWGIGFISAIIDPATNAIVWSPSGKNSQITGIFYGGKDFFGRQDATLTQTIAQIGLSIDLYEQTGQIPAPSLAGTSPGQRTGPNTFPNFAPSGGPSTLLGRFNSINGFLDAGAGATDAEVVTTFTNSVGAQGSVQGFLSVDNSVGQQAGGVSIFENNGFAGIFNNNLADARFILAEQTNSPSNPWLVSVNGPLNTSIVPEPSTFLTGLACMLPMFGAALARRRATRA